MPDEMKDRTQERTAARNPRPALKYGKLSASAEEPVIEEALYQELSDDSFECALTSHSSSLEQLSVLG